MVLPGAQEHLRRSEDGKSELEAARPTAGGDMAAEGKPRAGSADGDPKSMGRLSTLAK